MDQLLQTDPDKRPSVDQVLQNDYVQETLKKVEEERLKRANEKPKRFRPNFKGSIYSIKTSKQTSRATSKSKKPRTPSLGQHKKKRFSIERKGQRQKDMRVFSGSKAREAKKPKRRKSVHRRGDSRKPTRENSRQRGRESNPKKKANAFVIRVPSGDLAMQFNKVETPSANSFFEDKDAIKFELSVSREKKKRNNSRVKQTRFNDNRKEKDVFANRSQRNLENSRKVRKKFEKQKKRCSQRSDQVRNIIIKSYRVVKKPKASNRVINRKIKSKNSSPKFNRHLEIQKLQKELKRLKSGSSQIRKIRKGCNLKKSHVQRNFKKNRSRLQSPNLKKKTKGLNLEQFYRA